MDIVFENEYGWHFVHSIYTRIKSVNPKTPMGMGMNTTIQNSMDMDMSMRMTFKNEYGYRYSSTRPEPALCPSLISSAGDY